MQIYTTSSKLNIYHSELSHDRGKSPIDSRCLYGIDVQMKSEKRKPHILMLTNSSSSLSISFNTQAEAQQWFIALTKITGTKRKMCYVHYNNIVQGAFIFN